MGNLFKNLIIAALLLIASSAPALAALPHTFATQPGGNVPASYLDGNFTFLQSEGVQGVQIGGTPNAYIATVADAWVGGYDNYVARALTVIPTFTNTGAATINVSGMGNVSIYKNIGGDSTALDPGDLQADIPAVIVCDGTGFLLANPTLNFQINPTFRNFLVNGDELVAQRGTSFTAIGTTIAYTADRWFGNTTSGAVESVSQQASGSAGFNKVLRVGRTAASADTSNIKISQVVESINAIPLQGKSVTFSFYARSGANFSASGSTLSAAVVSGTATDEGAQAFANGTWTGASTIANMSETLTASLTRYTITASVPSNATELAVVLFYVPTGTAGASDFFEMTDLQLEQGAVVTAYESLPFDVSLARCLRYYWRWTPLTTTDVIAMGGVFNATSLTDFVVRFPVKMRIAPTAVIGGTASTDYIMNLNNATQAPVSIATSAATPYSILIQVTTGALTAGFSARLRFATTSGFLEFKAEL